MARIACDTKSGRVDRPPWPTMGVIVLAIALAATLGCGQPQYLGVRKVPHNPLAGPLKLLSRRGPEPTDRTLQTLRQLDLNETYESDPSEALQNLQQELLREPTSDKIRALSELAYIRGFELDAIGQDARALNWYGAAVFNAYDYLFDPFFDVQRNPYDPQFRRMCDLYNSGLEALLRIIRDQGQLLPGKATVVDTGAEQIRLDVVSSSTHPPEEYERLEFVSDYKVTGLKNHHHGYGLGVPLIGVRRSGSKNDPVEQYYLARASFPITAFLRIVPGHIGQTQPGHAARRCVLELYDPLDSNTLTVSNRLVPLETDLSTPLGYKLEESQTASPISIATWGLLNPSSTDEIAGLYMLEPYDPNKIPVLMVHGLWSSPMTWMEMFNDLLSYPEIRENYQFWFYLYPTGEPFWFSANELRRELANLRGTLDPGGRNPIFDQMVLVGHSMGGLVSMMQTIESRDQFWNLLSEQPFTELKADAEVKYQVAQTVFFHPSPSVHRLISLGTPYRGSRFANDYTRYLARKLISLPQRILWVTQQLVLENPGYFADTDLLTISTSIDSLSPKSPVLPVMLEAERADWVHYHNVVGVASNKSWLARFTRRGDGVVPYDSAHRPDFESELVVDADHMGVHSHPRSILEVRRILLQQLAEIRSVGDGTERAGSPATGHVLPAAHNDRRQPSWEGYPAVR